MHLSPSAALHPVLQVLPFSPPGRAHIFPSRLFLKTHCTRLNFHLAFGCHKNVVGSSHPEVVMHADFLLAFFFFFFFLLFLYFFLSWNMLSDCSSYAQLTRDDAELSPWSEHWIQLHTSLTAGCCLDWSWLPLDGLTPMPCPLKSWKCQPELPGVWVKAVDWYPWGRCKIWVYSYVTNQKGENCHFEDGPG